jgi:hypothetical protein
MKDLIKTILRKTMLESNFNLDAIKLVKPIELDDETKNKIKTINSEDIVVGDAKPMSGNKYTIPLSIRGFGLEENILLILKVLPSGFYVTYEIELASELRGLGLGYKIFYKVLTEFGHLLSLKSNRLNDKEIPSIFNKFKGSSDVEVIDNDGNILLVYKNNPDYDTIINRFKKF